MKGKDDAIFLKHILESIELIEQYTHNVTMEQFLDNPQMQDAIIRRFEIIGEATKNISSTIRTTHPDIPWKSMAGIRDILIHEYFGVDLDEIWDTCMNDLPILKEQIKKILYNR